jgi:DNA repair exonuclease SbcCD nuclease subunit
MTSIWTSDIHLDASTKNEYRFDILPWLESTALAKRVDFVGINGDLTEAKDKHPSTLVNRIVEFFARSKNQWVINVGNHDFYNPECPFFGFLRNFENIRIIQKPTAIKLPVAADYTRTLILPSTKNWQELWSPYFENGLSYPYVFVHATFDGTTAETGFKLSGVPIKWFPRNQYGRVYAGDIHMPGPISKRMEYIGSPHRVYFGDTFDPRVIWISKKEIFDIYPGLTSRHVVVIRKVGDLKRYEEIRAGDQVKIRVRLRRSDFPEWVRIRKEIAEEAASLGWVSHGIEIKELIQREKLSEEVLAQAAKYMPPKARMLAYADTKGLSEAETKFGISLL